MMTNFFKPLKKRINTPDLFDSEITPVKILLIASVLISTFVYGIVSFKVMSSC